MIAIATDAPARSGRHNAEIAVRRLGRAAYEPTWRSMQDYTAQRGDNGADELWLVEHPPVYTLGVAGRPDHLPRVANGIPVVKVDRGGQITYHGPGQVGVYVRLDLRRRGLTVGSLVRSCSSQRRSVMRWVTFRPSGLTVRSLVRIMEQAVIDLLAAHGIAAEGRTEAPGVYVNGAKIAALGLRIRNGCSYHGLALNVDLDLAPFHAIDPCGYPGLSVTQTRDLGMPDGMDALGEQLIGHLRNRLK